MTSPMYSPIDSANGEIRLLIIEPAKKNSHEMRCKFSRAQLNKDPVYEALSYTWGGPAPDPGRFITLGSHRFPVFENLFAALVRLRHPTKSRTIWIDAVCINQGDYAEALREKEEQLFLMKRIYECAQRVVIWLGEPPIGERIAMQSLANTSGSLFLSAKIWKTERKFGLGKGPKNRFLQSLSGEWEPRALEIGELAQLLDRKWWRRVWIVQEVVLAKKAVVMCGPDVVPWENIGKGLRTGMFSILGQEDGQWVKRTNEGSVVAKYTFPDAEYCTLIALQNQWRSQTWNQSIYSLLYAFRSYEATNPKDRIYAFLGLLGDKGIIKPDYSTTTSAVYTNVAKALIVAHKHLLIFNLKREPDKESRTTRQQAQIYSLLDQIRFLDPNALVVEGENVIPRKGWVRLPHGWERCQDGTNFAFHNHLTGEKRLVSPLVGQPPALPQHMQHWADLPNGWRKTWDNVGKAQFVFDPDGTEPTRPGDTELDNLPSWVPNWTQWSTKDSEPLLSLIDGKPRYYACGKARRVRFGSADDSDSARLKLTGIVFDTIVSISLPWCPEPHLLPIDRLDNTLLQAWEMLATKPVPNCPYTNSGGRYNAYWRTHIADYPGPQSATDDDKNFFETWANREQWASRVPDSFSDIDKTNWQKFRETAGQAFIMNNMSSYMIDKGYMKVAVHFATSYMYKRHAEIVARYNALRDRIHNASVGRAMFVTEKGFIGLAPWNAKEGDVVSVLFGGNTPFLLRKTFSEETYTLVGEAYVYGIMGGELFSGEMEHAPLRTFEIV
jgi:hypothetical protein